MRRSIARRRLATLAVAAIAATAAAPAAAHAAGATGCPDTPMSNPFAPWGDSADYLLAPDGGLEAGGALWTLAGGAAVAAGNESFQVGGPADAKSLALPAGATATTAPMCIGVEHRTMRFFVKGAGARKGSVKVEILYTDRDGAARSRRIGDVSGGRSWAPSPIVALVVNRLAPARGNAMQVSFRFTAKGGASVIDDVYVDPFRKV